MIILAYKRRWLRAAQSVLVALFLIPAGMSSVYAATVQEEAALELFNEGFQLYQSGNFESAKERFESGLELAPKNTTALYYLGRVLEEQGDARGASVNYQAAFDSGPDTKDGILAKSAKNRLDSRAKRIEEEVNAAPSGQNTPLHIAAWENDVATATLLFEKGAAVNAKGQFGSTPLHFAAFNNAVETATLLVERGAAVNAKDDDGETPLHEAAWTNAVAIATLLLERGAAVNAKDNDGDTPLHEAARNNAVETATLLIERGAAVNAKNNDGETPLAALLANQADWKKRAKKSDSAKSLYKEFKKEAKKTAALLRKHGGKKR